MEKSITKEFEALERDSAFISKYAKEFGEKYQKKFIAVYNGKIVAISSNFREILGQIKQKGLNPALVLIEYIPSKNEIVLY